MKAKENNKKKKPIEVECTYVKGERKVFFLALSLDFEALQKGSAKLN
jgi:hypothetical protein